MPAPSKKHRVIKTLGSNKPGAKRWALQYGQTLVCVRHRLDDARQQRITTVELVVETRPFCSPRPSPKSQQSAMVKVKLAHDDIERRRAAIGAGAIWLPSQHHWQMPLELAQALSVTDKIVADDS